MTRIDRMGIDLGTGSMAGPHASAAAAAGARLARVRFALEGRPLPDEAFLEAARSTATTLRAAGLGVLAVLDSDLTVAPEGMGAFEDRPPGPLALAWVDEMSANVAELAAGLGELVDAWEILPGPNPGDPPRIAPGRWAALLADFAAAIRGVVPGARIVAGGLVTDDADDGVDYLAAAYRAAEGAGVWTAEAPPFDMVGLQLYVLADGGASEDDVASLLRERVRRLWRVMERFEGTDRARERGLFVTGLAWDADRVGADVQARNLWAALDALTSEAFVQGVIWTGLTDAGPAAGGAIANGATGLYRGASIVPNDRRWAWSAFNDFAIYARQISPAPSAADLLGPLETSAPAAIVAAPESVEVESVEVEQEGGMGLPAAVAAAMALAVATTEDDQATVAAPDPSEDDTQPLALPVIDEAPPADEVAPAAEPLVEEASPVDEVPVDEVPMDEAPMDETPPVAEEPPVDEAPSLDESPLEEAVLLTGGVLLAEEAQPAEEAPAVAETPPVISMPVPDAPEPETIEFRIPDVAELLRDRGLDGPRLDAALEAIRLKYGAPERLGPGEYRVAIQPNASVPDGAADSFTNQQVISALYRAGGGTWGLFERSGLSLSELAARRNQPYDGPPIASNEALTDDERQAIERELGRAGS